MGQTIPTVAANYENMYTLYGVRDAFCMIYSFYVEMKL